MLPYGTPLFTVSTIKTYLFLLMAVIYFLLDRYETNQERAVLLDYVAIQLV